MSAVTDVLARAVAELAGEPEHEVAARLLADVPAHAEMLAARCAELPILLERTQDADSSLEWSLQAWAGKVGKHWATSF